MHQGSTNIIGKFINGVWKIQTVAGKSTGASAYRAGMGPKLTIDAAGTIMYRFSPYGQNL